MGKVTMCHISISLRRCSCFDISLLCLFELARTVLVLKEIAVWMHTLVQRGYAGVGIGVGVGPC